MKCPSEITGLDDETAPDNRRPRSLGVMAGASLFPACMLNLQAPLPVSTNNGQGVMTIQHGQGGRGGGGGGGWEGNGVL